MDDEKLQKTIEFILNNQAQFTIDIQKINEAHKDAEKRIHTLEKISLNLSNTTVEQGKNVAELSKDVKELRAAQKETNERFDAVIVRFKNFLDRQNGQKS